MTKANLAPLWLPPESDLPATRSPILWGPWLVLALVSLAYALGFGWLDIVRHQAFQTHTFDLGHMDQAVWNTLHGHPLRFTSMQVGHGVLTTRLAIHVEPILFPLSLLYVVHSGPETLLAAQAIIVALGALPAYLLARRLVDMPWLSLVFPLAYLLHPSLQHAVVYEFHAVTLSACFLSWAIYFAYSRSALPFALTAILAASTKEEIGLLVAMLGLLCLLRRRWYLGIMTIACGVGWTAMCFLWIIPHFSSSGQSPYLDRYSYLGHGFGGLIQEMLRRPGAIVSILTSPARLDYLDRLLHPLGFVPLLGAPVLLLALPSLLINMLSAKPEMYSGFYQYSAPIVPFAVAAAIVGAAAAMRFARAKRIRGSEGMGVVLCLFVLVAALLEATRYGSSPIATVQQVPSVGLHQRLEQTLLRAIPRSSVVAASDEVEPHLSDRYWVYLLPLLHPRNGPPAWYIALDASIPSWPVRPGQLHAVAARSLASGYSVEAAHDGILILKRGRGRKTLPAGFWTFLFQHGRMTRSGAQWGPLRLVGYAAPPKGAVIDPLISSIGLDTYWSATHRLPRTVRVAVYVSPVYSGRHPAFSWSWRVERGSPAWDWLSMTVWPVGPTIHAAIVPLRPDVRRSGKVDLVLAVSGLGPVHGASRGQRVPAFPTLLRLATVTIGH